MSSNGLTTLQEKNLIYKKYGGCLYGNPYIFYSFYNEDKPQKY